jgi:hypothetical protein
MEGWLMPQAIPLILSYVASTFVAIEGIGAAVMLISSLALSSYQSGKAKDKQRDQFNAAQVDRMANVVTTVARRELVLGRVRKGGPVVFRGSAGALSEKFLVHIALAAHEIDAVEGVYLNDVEVNIDGDGNVLTAPYRQFSRETVTERITGTVLSPITSIELDHEPLPGTFKAIAQGGSQQLPDTEYAATVDGTTVTFDPPLESIADITYQWRMTHYHARLWWDLGDGTAVADARTMELFPDEWTADHRGQGIAKLICEFNYNETAFPNGLPAITARVRGAKVYDPRDETTAWSDNPALLARHVYQHSHFGKATVSEDEDARFIAAANACDVEHDYVVDGDTETRPLYTAGMVAQFGAQASSLLTDLTQAMAGMWAFAGGELHIRAGVWTSHVKDLTDSDLAVVQRSGDSENQEQLTISVHRERAEKFNTVNLRIWDDGQEYKQVALSPVKGAALITRDGVELAQEMTLAAVSHAGQAQHIAGVMMRDARDPLTVEAPFKMTAYPLEMFDVVRLTLARYGWVNKQFIILGRVWQHDKGVIKLTMKETAASIFTPDASFLPQGRADNTRLPRPWEIEPPVLLAANVFSGTDELTQNSDGTIITRVRPTWAALTDPRVTSSGWIDVRWKPVALATQWQTVTVDGDATEAIIVGPKDRRAIVMRARSRTSVAVSDWSEQVVHVVVGKTEAPSRVGTPFTATQSGRRVKLRWPDNEEVDVRVYEIRTTDADWGDENYLWRGRATYALVDAPAAGVSVTWYIKARDTSGNYSTLSRSVVMTGGVPDTLPSLTLTRTGRDIEMLAVISGITVPDDLKHYEFRIEKDGAGDVWSSGTLTDTVKSQRRRAIWRAPSLGTFRISVRMVDLYNNESAASASASITISRPTAP